jgi:hypothetical protein
MGNCLCWCLPTTASSGCLRKRTGRNASEPICSAVRSNLQPGEGNGSVEPLFPRRRLERPIAGQDTYMSVGGIGARRKPRILPEDNGNGMGRLPGVARMACVESTLVNHGRSNHGLQSRRSNRSIGAERHGWKSERFIVVMTVGTTQPHRSKGTVLSQRLLNKQRPAQSSEEVEHAL